MRLLRFVFPIVIACLWSASVDADLGHAWWKDVDCHACSDAVRFDLGLGALKSTHQVTRDIETVLDLSIDKRATDVRDSVHLAQSPISAFPPGTFDGRAARSPAPITFQGMGDIVGGATAWGSCARAYNAAYANGTNSACDLVAVTGGAAVCTLRIATSGFVDLSAAYCPGSLTPSAACVAASGGSCNVPKAYDQTGNGNHWTNGTLATMPALTFNALNGLPGMTTVAATGNNLQTAGNVNPASSVSVTTVFKRTGSFTSTATALGQSGTAFAIGDSASANTAVFTSGGTNLTGTAADSAFHALQGVGNGGAGSVINVDGSEASGTSSASTASPLRIGRGSGCCTPDGVIMEVGIWVGTQFSSGQRTSMNTNMHGTNGYNF